MEKNRSIYTIKIFSVNRKVMEKTNQQLVTKREDTANKSYLFGSFQ